jgi:DNA-binding NarL/FixJ family response regulator
MQETPDIHGACVHVTNDKSAVPVADADLSSIHVHRRPSGVVWFQAEQMSGRDVERSSEEHKMASLRLFLADDHEIVRYGLRSLLETKVGWTIVGEAADGKAAIEGVLASDPDVTLMDISMPVVDGLQAARKILASGSRTRILMVSIYDSKEVLGQVVDSGARGFVLKSDAARDLIAAVEAIDEDGTFFTPKTAEIILDRQLDRMQEQRDHRAISKKVHARH